MQTPRRRDRDRQPAPNPFRLGPALGLLAILALIVAVVVISRIGQGSGQVAAGTAGTPTVRVATPVPATRLPTPGGGPTEEPTPPSAGFTLQDRCVTTTLDFPGGPSHIVGGGLEVDMQADSLPSLTFAGNLAVDKVCSGPISPAEVESLIQQIGQVPGITIRRYSYSGG